MAPATTRNLTILITDIKGFTDKTSHRSRADIQRLLDDHREVVLPVLEGRGGRLVKTMGDAFMMAYDSPTDAVLAGVAAQDALAKHNHDLPESERIEIRVAINSGEVNLADNDVFGEAVNIAARIEGIAEAGEVYFTEAVYLAMNKTEVPSSEIGLLQLKGIPEKVRVYKVRHETPLGVGQVPARTPTPQASGFAPGEKARFAPETAPVSVSDGVAKGPKLRRRAVALALDGLICAMLVGMVDGKHNLFPLGWFAYNLVFLWILAGMTPGKKLMGLRVVAEDGGVLDLKRAALRSLMSLVSGAALLFGYAWGLWDAHGRTWHDAVAGTRVVSVE